MATPVSEATTRCWPWPPTGDVLMARCVRDAPTPPAALDTSSGTLRRSQGTTRCFYTHAVVSACRQLDASSVNTSLRELIEAIPEQDWTPIPYWMDGAADVAETTYTPFQSEPDAAPVRSSSGG